MMTTIFDLEPSFYVSEALFGNLDLRKSLYINIYLAERNGVARYIKKKHVLSYGMCVTRCVGTTAHACKEGRRKNNK